MPTLSFDSMNSSITRRGESVGIHSRYQQVAEEYPFKTTRDHKIFWEDEKTKLPDPNIGWKIHLNVHPDDVGMVINYLKTNDLEHKYLMGADLKDGKIFTVYLGPKSNLIKWAKQIDAELGSILLPVQSESDITIQGNIAGRFVGEKSRYSTKSSYRGITLMEVWKEALNQVENKENIQNRAFEATDADLTRRYGEYYGGNNFPNETTNIVTNSFQNLWQETFRS